MYLVPGIIIAHLRPKTGASDLNMKSCIVFLFVLAECFFLCNHAVGDSLTGANYKKSFERKKARLERIHNWYQTVENQGYIDPSFGAPTYETLKYALMGSLSTSMNYQRAPKEQVNIKDYVVEKLEENGPFSAYVFVDSLAEGDIYYRLEGDFDMDALKVDVQYQKRLSRKDYEAAKASLPPTLLQSLVQYSEGNVTFNNGSNDIDHLLNLCKNTKCMNGSKGVCKRGDVVMDAWLNNTMAFQRRLARDTPINYVQWVGSHNSFNNKADGYGSGETMIETLLRLVTRGKQKFVWAQQFFTITDQLNMGSRYFMLNPVYVWDAMRLCHGGLSSSGFNKIIDYLEKVLHKKIKFDSGDLGCLPTDRLFSAAVQEIRDWLMWPGHESEVVLIMIDDYAADKDWNRQDLIWGPIHDILGDLAFTRSLKANCCQDFWPSQNKMVSMGKRVLVLGTNRVENDSVFLDMTRPYWDKDTMKYFTPYPDCQGFQPGSWFVQGGESQMAGSIYNGPEEQGLIVQDNYQLVLQCPVNIFKLDLMSPDLLNSSIWTWKYGFSAPNVTKGSCAVMQHDQDGRWTTINCASTNCHQACTNSTHIVLSSDSSAWGSPSCPSGFTAGCPTDGHQNWQLYASLNPDAGKNCVWLDLSKFN